MNILEFIEQQKDVEQLSFEYNGEKVDFWVKNLSVSESEELNDPVLVRIYEKQKNKQTLTDSEVKSMLTFESKQSYKLLCKEVGSPLYASLEEFKNKIKGAFLKAVNKEVRQFTKADDEEAEKN